MHHCQMDSPSGFEPIEEAAGEGFPARVSNPSPNDIFPSKVLCPWLEQSTSDDCVFLAPQQVESHSSASPCQLVASGSRASSPNIPALEGSLSRTALPSIADTICNSSTPLAAGLPSIRSSTDHLSSGQSIVDPVTEGLEAFFAAALGSSKKMKVEQLVGVVRGYSEGFSDGFNQRLSRWYNFWPEPEAVLKGEPILEMVFEAGVACRLRRLGQARSKIEKKAWGATRLWLLFLAHEVEYISQWEHIYLWTSRGVDPMSAAIKMATNYLPTAKSDYQRARNIVQIMKEGGPASVLENGGLSQTKWETGMTLHDITCTFACIKNKLPAVHKRAESHNEEVAKAILNGFKKYGWSFSSLRDSKTKVIVILKPYLQSTESKNKRWRVDQSGAALSSLSSHDFPANLLNQGSNDFDQATSSRNTVESTPGSNSIHLITFDAKNRTRDLTDPVITSNLSHAVNSRDEFIDCIVVQFLQLAVSESAELTDPSTERLLQGATSQFYPTNDFICPFTANISRDPRMMSNLTAAGMLSRMDC
ncbi:hypothetical protein BKA61DRAFT_674650 [Leptodontidium sp. MPI-SDFR-AT-0119]|nr:hypothetical protein BKA61DRAFT_674650 [Leptodontidium sp. MPI-SDFR-AT-0119]